jgi:hypothetical protein
VEIENESTLIEGERERGREGGERGRATGIEPARVNKLAQHQLAPPINTSGGAIYLEVRNSIRTTFDFKHRQK